MLSINPKKLYVRNRKTGKFVPLVAIIGPPGSIDNITDYLTNETGDSEELAMSQKGVTLLLAAVVTELEKTKSEFKRTPILFLSIVQRPTGRSDYFWDYLRDP